MIEPTKILHSLDGSTSITYTYRVQPDLTTIPITITPFVERKPVPSKAKVKELEVVVPNTPIDEIVKMVITRLSNLPHEAALSKKESIQLYEKIAGGVYDLMYAMARSEEPK